MLKPDYIIESIQQEINSYLNFNSSIYTYNEALKIKIDNLQSNLKYDEIKYISDALDSYVSSIIISDAGCYSTDLECIKMTKHGDKVRTQNFINVLYTILNSSYVKLNDQNQLRGEILSDLELKEKTEFGEFSNSKVNSKKVYISIPFSFKVKYSNEWNRQYSDGTTINLNLSYYYLPMSNINTKLSSLSYVDSIRNSFNTDTISLNLGFKTNINSNRISDVKFNSPSYVAGLQIADKILEIQNLPFNINNLELSQNKKIGDTIVIKIQRGQELLSKNLILSKNDDLLLHYDIILGDIGGFMVALKEEFMDYGEIKKIINVTCMNSIDEQLLLIKYRIKLSESLGKKSYEEIFEEIKPLIKGINDSVTLNN